MDLVKMIKFSISHIISQSLTLFKNLEEMSVHPPKKKINKNELQTMNLKLHLGNFTFSKTK